MSLRLPRLGRMVAGQLEWSLSWGEAAEGDFWGDVFEGDFEWHANVNVSGGGAAKVAHHDRAFFELYQAGVVGNVLHEAIPIGAVKLDPGQESGLATDDEPFLFV